MNNTLKYFKDIKNLKDLKEFVKKNEENYYIEYKPSEILNKLDLQTQNKNEYKKDLLETISAFANSSGGLIIIGVDEKNRNLDQGVNLEKWYKKRLEDLINGNIIPPLREIFIKVIKKNKKNGYFLININEGITAYQNNIDKCYYGRFEESDRKLEHHWITLLINKTQKPIFEVYLIPEQFQSRTDLQTFRPGFFIEIENISTAISEKFCIEIRGTEEIRLDCLRGLDGAGNIYITPNNNTITLYSNHHFDNKLLFFPFKKTRIKRHDGRDFYIYFDSYNPYGTLEIKIFSENPQSQYFCYYFKPGDINKIFENNEIIKMKIKT